ncbi:MAG: ATP-binding protein [Gammaproteobacteria bacterium]|jgi:AAA+ ATPase superfamily predicted ATPase|nr:ATP-binding protein [Gammaproteobacteria bacterium]
MIEKLVGREDELQALEELYNSVRPEFLAIYGRRRVGKTMLIRWFFRNKNASFLNTVGLLQGTLKDQIANFTQQIEETFYKGVHLKSGKNWNETFKLLTDTIKNIEPNKKIILFFDEFPWMETKNSRLLQNLDYYWNRYWSTDSRIKLIICGSSASWIIKKIINNKGGLHNRVTRKIQLQPYNLRDTKRFLNHIGVTLNNRQIIQIYMVTGGIPYYLSYLKAGLSAVQNIANLAFSRKSFLLTEFDNLFSALFGDASTYIEIVRVIANHKYGIDQERLFELIKDISKGGRAGEKLKALEDAGFIIKLKPHLNTKKGIYYKAIDEYTLFYFDWIEPVKDTLLARGLKKNYWESIQNTPQWNNWAGYAFESVCYKHISQISDALNLSPTAIPNSWQYNPTKKSNISGAQIDLLFDRDDDAITICEIKYTDHPFAIDKSYADKLKKKLQVYQQITKTKKQLFLAMISANGIKKTMYSEEMINAVVTLDNLFEKEN